MNSKRTTAREETTMETWCIVWSQTFPETGTVRHVDKVDAINAAQALAQWGSKCYCNARVEAVWRQDFAGDCDRILGDGIADNRTRGAADSGNGTRAGDGRRMPEWVRRAKLVVYWRYATQVAGTMTRADLESAFACEYTSRWKAELECERLRENGGVR